MTIPTPGNWPGQGSRVGIDQYLLDFVCLQMKVSLPDEDPKTIDVDVKADKVSAEELIVKRKCLLC